MPLTRLSRDRAVSWWPAQRHTGGVVLWRGAYSLACASGSGSQAEPYRSGGTAM